jgi:hypothetical protein
MNVRVTAHSQSDRLRERATEAKIAHGDEVRVDLPNVRVAVGAVAAPSFLPWKRRGDDRPDGDVYFCNIGAIRVRELVSIGDGKPLPVDVTLEGLSVSGSGYYDITNALMRSNGRIEVVVDDETVVRESELSALTPGQP